MESVYKTCSQCEQTKQIDEYYKMAASRDGHHQECKKCAAERRRAWYQNNRAKQQTYNRGYYSKNRDKQLAYVREYYNTERGREVDKAKKARYRENHPERHQAHNAVGYAVSKGHLMRVSECECIECGKQAEHYHHHRGYEYKLDVVPMCRTCHRKHHID